MDETGKLGKIGVMTCELRDVMGKTGKLGKIGAVISEVMGEIHELDEVTDELVLSCLSGSGTLSIQM